MRLTVYLHFVALRPGVKYFLPAVGGHWVARKTARAQNNIQKKYSFNKIQDTFYQSLPLKIPLRLVHLFNTVNYPSFQPLLILIMPAHA